MKTAPRWTRSAISQPKVHPQHWRYGSCETHVGHPSRAAAKRAIRDHLSRPCAKCYRGARIDWFVCPTSLGHLHIGHTWPAAGERTA